MNYYLGIFVPFCLFIIGIWYSYSIHRRQFKASHSPSIREIVLFLIPALIKSIITMGLIIIIHNSFHDDHFIELAFFIIVLFTFSIFQSSYSLGGFLTRSKSLLYYSKTFFNDSGTRVDNFINRVTDIFVGKGQFFVKGIIFIVFIVVFIPNITIFITGNILYLVIIVLLIVLSLLLNNIIYFGIISILIFQVDPVSIHLIDANYLVLTTSFIVLLIGFSIEDRLEDKMFLPLKVMEVKRFNFKLGYNVLFHKPRVTIYQNIINKYYYVYFRDIGLVIVFYSDFDIKLSNSILKYLIKEGRTLLLKNSEYI